MEFKALMELTPEEDIRQFRMVHGDNATIPEEIRTFTTVDIEMPINNIVFFHDLPDKEHEGHRMTRIFTHMHGSFDLVVEFEELQKIKKRI